MSTNRAFDHSLELAVGPDLGGSGHSVCLRAEATWRSRNKRRLIDEGEGHAKSINAFRQLFIDHSTSAVGGRLSATGGGG